MRSLDQRGGFLSLLALTETGKNSLVPFPLISSTFNSSKDTGILKTINHSTAQFQQLAGFRGKDEMRRKKLSHKEHGIRPVSADQGTACGRSVRDRSPSHTFLHFSNASSPALRFLLLCGLGTSDKSNKVLSKVRAQNAL